jgi:hypothetical protein
MELGRVLAIQELETGLYLRCGISRSSPFHNVVLPKYRSISTPRLFDKPLSTPDIKEEDEIRLFTRNMKQSPLARLSSLGYKPKKRSFVLPL